MKKYFVLALLLLAGPVYADMPTPKPAVNPALAAFQDNLDDPQLIELGRKGRVHMVFGYDYSNWTIIEGDDGLIVVDSGWFVERTQQAISDYRAATGTKKPVKAVILTHMHSDHIAGIQGLFADGKVEGVDIYAHTDWQRQVAYDTNSGDMLIRRGMAQMGFLLPYKDVAAGTYGAGIGRGALQGGTLSATFPPTHTVDVSAATGPVKHTIAGIPVEFHYAPSDIDAQLMVWLPEDKVILVGDAIGGTLPYVITPRHEPERKPESFLYTFDQILSLDAQDMVPGHGRPVRGRNDLEAIIRSNHEVIAFLHEQVRGYVGRGYNADQIIDELELPPRLANNPDLQPRYHTLDWLIRGLYTNEAGWVQNVNSLTQHSASEQARRLSLLIGEDKLLQAAAGAIETKDYRWAVSLAQLLLDANPDNARARQLQIAGLRGVAYTTESAAERNYALTEVGAIAGAFNWDNVITRVSARQWAVRDAAAAFELFGERFRSAPAYGKSLAVTFNVAAEGAFSFRVNDGTLHYERGALEKADAVIDIDLATMRKVGSRELTLAEALEQPSTKITQDDGRAALEFAALIR
ncbi:alkyl sulfatase dimerization domain-containing protein [Pseudohalioglobus lutimaris]|uniref:Metallo-beta-lactamase domain-containing protein n=1 Tax=Pseudohalioglobus lutimaris TaxID=1737061 RepID=A0A2N5WYD3_9GAMM|nr:alkyl sulfatase dimerization domain-containing protein [Pseudohalioglobus lutimaris]PLW67218.1 hypothetical protein C0039_17970 [Pseudohalioglobus lutimaris]